MIRAVFSRKSIYWFMIALTGGAVVFSGLPGMIKALMSSADVIGTVNGLPIALYEYRAEIAKEQRMLALYREQFGPNYHKILSYLGKSENAEQSAQEQIITSKLLLSMAHSIPVYLHSAYITRELAQPRTIYGILGEAIPSHYLFTEQGILKIDQLRRFLKTQGLTMEQFEKLAENLLESQWGLKLSLGATFVSKSAQELFNRLNFHTQTFKLESVDLLSLVKAERMKPASEEELREFYENNRSSSVYWSAERRSGSVWSFELSNFSPEDGKSSDKDQMETIQKQHFIESAQQLILLGDEKSLQQFVKSYQAQPSALDKLVKPQPHAKDTDPLIKALFSIGTIGERAVTTKGSKGYIVSMSELVPPQRLDFELVRDKVADNLYISRARAQGLEILREGTNPRMSIQSFKHSAHSKNLPEALAKLDIPVSALAGLLIVGSSKEGTNDRTAYRVTLIESELDEKKFKEASGGGENTKRLFEEAGDLALRNLIASLRNHAIILIRTESEIHN